MEMWGVVVVWGGMMRTISGRGPGPGWPAEADDLFIYQPPIAGRGAS